MQSDKKKKDIQIERDAKSICILKWHNLVQGNFNEFIKILLEPMSECSNPT